jgi:hypothetical protein
MEKKRKVIDCRWFPTDKPCDVAISGNEKDVLNIAVEHAVRSHGHKDTPELREQLRSMLRDERKEQAA